MREVERFARILQVKDAIEPILAVPVQIAVHEWQTEIDHPQELKDAKITPRRTCMLYGPPGTGKTTLAHHLAAKRKRPLVAVQSERLVSKFLGETSSQVGQLFDILDAMGDEAMVLFDEFDAIGTKRSEDKGGGALNEMNRSVTVTLRRLEQFQGTAIAATNTKNAIDPANWRRPCSTSRSCGVTAARSLASRK